MRKKQANISLSCMKCNEFCLMPILEKLKIEGKVFYVIRCPKCNFVFGQFKPLNFFRDIKVRYKLSQKEMCELQRKIIEPAIKAFLNGKTEYEDKRTFVKIGDRTILIPAGICKKLKNPQFI